MDLDRALVASILREGKAALLAVREQGVRPELLQGSGRTAFEFLIAYSNDYDGLPSKDVLEAKFSLSLPDAPEPPAFFAHEVLSRSLHAELREKLETVVANLEQSKPYEALDQLEVTLREVRQSRTMQLSKVESIPALFPEVVAYYDRIKSGARGVLFPWEAINEETLGMWPEDLVLFVARVAIGKCTTRTALLQDPSTGLVRTIEQLYGDDTIPSTTTWSPERGLHVVPITAKVDTGHKECLKVTLASGRYVEVTPEHPLMTPMGWKRTDELVVGATIATPSRMPLPLCPIELPAHHVDTLAIVIADGSSSGHHVSFTKHDAVVVDIAQKAADRFGILLKEDVPGTWRFTRGPGLQQPNPVRELLQQHGLDGCLSKHKQVPDAIFRLPEKQLRRFLSLLFMCDGYVDSTGPGITLASKKLVEQIQHLLLRLGIQSSVHYKKAKCQTGEFDAWRLRVYTFCLGTFAEKLELWGEKAARVARLLKKAVRSNVGCPRVSRELVEAIKAEAGEQKGRWTSPERTAAKRRVADRLGWREFSAKQMFNRRGDFYSLGLPSLRVFCEEFGCTEKYRWLWDSDLYWDEVVAIEPIGEQKVYDLTVEPTKCYVANDVLMHNTWSAVLIGQNAWVKGNRVLFATTEISKLRVAMRFASVQFRLPYGQLRKAQLDHFAEKRFREGVNEIIESQGLSVIGGDFDFRPETYEAAIESYKPNLSMFDGAYLLKMVGKDRIEAAANSFNELKRISKRTGCPQVVTSQLNRQVKANAASSAGVTADKIAMTDVAGWNADIIYALIQTEDMKRDAKMKMKPLKLREGSGDEFECNWSFDRMDFTQIGSVAGDADEGDDPFSTGIDPAEADDTDIPF